MTDGSMLWQWTGAGAEAMTGGGMQPLALSGATPLAAGRFGNATRLEEGTTNLITNPSAEIDAAGWTTGGTNTIARSTVRAKFGSASIEATYQDSTSLANFDITLTAALHYESVWVYVPSDYDGGGVRIVVNNFTGITINDSANNAVNMSLRDQWQRIWEGFTPDAGDLTGTLLIQNTGAAPTAGRSIFVDGLQLEQRSDASTYCDGSLGVGYSWSGGAHASTSTRDASLVEAAALFDEQQGAVAVWLRPLWAGGAGAQRSVLHRRVDANNALHLYHTAGGNWRTEWVSGGRTESAEAASGHATNDDVFLVFNWSASSVEVSVNGGTLVTAARGAAPDLSAELLMAVGRQQDAASGYLNAVVGPALIFDRALAQGEVQALWQLTQAPVWQQLSTVPNLLRTRERVRRDLRDEDATDQRWSDDEIDRHIGRALHELALAAPLEASATLQTQASSRDVDISALTDRVVVDAVEYPTGEYPPVYARFSLWGDTLTLLVDRLPGGAENVVVRYAALHTLTVAGSTLPRALEELVATGAAAYAALEWASYATNRVNVGGADVWRQYQQWGQERLAAFQEALATNGRERRVRARRLYRPAAGALGARPLAE